MLITEIRSKIMPYRTILFTKTIIKSQTTHLFYVCKIPLAVTTCSMRAHNNNLHCRSNATFVSFKY